MKMLNCPECGLTITDVQKECPKCRTKIENIKEELEKEVGALEDKKEALKKDEMIETAALTEAENVVEETSAKVKEELIAAVVEAEALAAIEEEEATADEEHLCETCLAPVDEGQNFCQLCGSSVEAIEETVHPILPKTDEESNKLIAAIGYLIFVFPILCGYYRKSAFAKFHAKQATLLFISSTALFLGLIIFRDLLDRLFITNSVANIQTLENFLLGNISDSTIFTVNPPWHHGHGIFGGLFYHYLSWMLYALHLMPFALMIVGIINALQGKKRKLPIVGRFIKDEDVSEIETLEAFESHEIIE